MRLKRSKGRCCSMLSQEEKRAMVRIARGSIARRLGLPGEGEQPEITPAMREKKGVFVTIHKGGQLRGCIGNIEGRRPLQEAIADLALESAFGDPRFPGLGREEFPEIDIEISVLTELTKIDRVDEIEVGKHGLYIRKGVNSGLLLPQVATEYGWDSRTFLEQTCWKAGLPEDAWKEGAEIYIFGAEVFGEKELSGEDAD
jgi:AmmeMemoRadiSam system protein A